MKKLLFIILLVITNIGCGKDYKRTEFFVKNNCEFTIEIRASALVRYSDGYKEESKIDIIRSGELFSMRILEVSEGFKINGVFSKFAIYHDDIKSLLDALNNDIWTLTSTSKTKDEYTLFVDNSFFE